MSVRCKGREQHVNDVQTLYTAQKTKFLLADPGQQMDILYLPSGGTAAATYSVSSPPAGITGTFILLQFLDPVGNEVIIIYV